ncbi:MAG: sensor histidine kinase [Acidimicrobiales bacterium]
MNSERDLDLDTVADADIPEVQREAQAWLIENNRSDQRVLVIFAVIIGIPTAIAGIWWGVAVAVCILCVLPFRWKAAPHFRRGDVREGLIWTTLGAWFLTFPLVTVLPDLLAISIQNVIGPLILAAAYLKRRDVRRLTLWSVAVAGTLGVIGFWSPGAGLEDAVPRWVYVGGLTAFLVMNLLLVMADLQESNRVRLRIMHRAIDSNRGLQLADHELRESRRRLVVAADEERVRIERDLHDGAQQRLASLAMQLRLAAELADEGSPPTSDALYALHREVTEAVDELRDFAHGVYPARLNELGLSGALRAVARRSPISIDIDDRTVEIPDKTLDGEVEVGLYFVCLEAIQNATKHGGAGTSIEIGVSFDDGDLVVTVADDAGGFDPNTERSGRGLLNMADRVEALGGSLDIIPDLGSGTRVIARVPTSPSAVSDLLRGVT